MSAIAPGDLVFMAVRLCDCATCREPIGIPFVVTELGGDSSVDIWCVNNLGKIVGTGPVAWGLRGFNIPVSALKRIDPLPAEDEVEQPEAMTA